MTLVLSSKSCGDSDSSSSLETMVESRTENFTGKGVSLLLFSILTSLIDYLSIYCTIDSLSDAITIISVNSLVL